jgi:hypothetical protein
LNQFSGKAITAAAIVGQALGTGPDESDLCESKTVKEAARGDVSWLVSQSGVPGFLSLCQLIRNKEPVLKKLRQLVDTAIGKSMTLMDIPDWFLTSTPIDQMIAAVSNTPPSCSACPTFVRLYLMFGAAPGSEMLLVAAEAEARLADKKETAIVTFINSKHYATGSLPKYAKGRTGPKTGFLRSPNPSWEFHTHWYTSQGLLTSLHVKEAGEAEGAKGMEINKFLKDFPKLIARVRDIHGLSGVELQTTP